MREIVGTVIAVFLSAALIATISWREGINHATSNINETYVEPALRELGRDHQLTKKYTAEGDASDEFREWFLEEVPE